MEKKAERLIIYAGINELDLFSFNQIYAPLISPKSALLFISIIQRQKINNHFNAKWYSLDQFLMNQKLNRQEFKEYLSELEKLNLIRITYNKNLDENKELSIKVANISSLQEIFRNTKLLNQIKKNLSNEKFLELQCLTKEKEFEYEISSSINNTSYKNIEKEEEIIDSDTYFEFYNGVLKLLNCEFSINNEILRNIRDYYLEDKKISMVKLQQIAYMSMIKNSENKYEISNKNFLFLLEKHTDKNTHNFNFDEHRSFWSSIMNKSEDEIYSEFKKLFNNWECIHLYKLLTKKSQAPEILNKWIKENTDKGFSFPVLNGIMSMVMILIEKISVSYLSKVTETLWRDNQLKIENLIQHAKKIAKSDLSKGKNRLNILNSVNVDDLMNNHDSEF